MAIVPGRRLGPYEILSAIGAGGMGEVYRARDTRLDRIVAIKVLPAHLADRAELRERFDREAKTIASLNHPHICTLYDTGHQDGIDFLVMEYLEGETLAQRLLKGSLPIQQVLQYAIEISDALDKAHRKGITHRDLKPGNIMLTKSGTKLLDFGLAKLTQGAAPSNAQLSDLPTEKDPLTAQGTLLGTLQYMSPEQVEGKEVDARTDIFAFGAVVYEMATGKRAFEGKTQASVIGAIMSSEPAPMSSLQPMTPPSLDRVVKICLAKEPDDRWHAAKDLCDELKWIAGGSSQAVPTPIEQLNGMRVLGRRQLIIGVGALLLAALVTGLAVWHLKSLPQAPVTRTAINLPPGQQLAGLDIGPAVAVSPDGTRLAYVARQGETQQIYLRAMDSLESKPIPGTEEGVNPFFSPDGHWIGFFADGKLRKVSVSGGGVSDTQRCCDSPGGQLGQPGHDCLRNSLYPISSAGIRIGKRPATTDSFRKRGDRPRLARLSTWRQSGGLRYRSEWTWFPIRERRRSVCRDERTSESCPRWDQPAVRALGAPNLCARWEFGGRAVRSPAAGGVRRGGPSYRGRFAISDQRRRPI